MPLHALADLSNATAASQAEMEAGTETALRVMSPLRVSQAIAALGGGGGTWGSITGTLSAQTDLQAVLDEKIASDVTGVTGADVVTNIISLTQAEYDAIGAPSASTYYIITDAAAGTLAQFDATTSAQLAGVISDETGTGSLVFANSPTLVTPALGTPASGTLTSCTGLPVSTGIAGLGTGIATALAVNTGSAGAPVIFNGALGTPTSGTISTGVVIPWEITVACSDETTALTTGTAKVSFRMPWAATLTEVRSNVGTAPTGATLVVDINEGDTPTSVLSTKLSIDISEKTSTTAATAAVISDSALADDALITIDIDQIGSTIAGAGLKVTLKGTRTV